jgi:predicted nucleotidyltransferase
MQHPKLSRILEDLRQRLAQLYGERLVQLVLYGSQARGDAAPDSDIDVLVVLADAVDVYEEIKRVSHIISDMCMAYEGVYVACVFMSVYQLQMPASPLLATIRYEGKIF